MRYSPTVVDHFLNPRKAGIMRDPDGVGEEEDGGCGDLARFYLRVTDGRIADVRFQTYGCGPTIAAASVAGMLVDGRGVEDLVSLEADELERALGGLPDDRRHAVEVVAGAVRAAALDHLRRRDIDV